MMDRLFAHNARGLLIILVIFGHLLEQRLQVNDVAGATYIFLYAFHMPAIAFLSGSATRAHNGPAELGNTALKLLQPLIICQLLFLPLEMALADEGKNWFRYAVTPYWVLWYLLSLAAWRLLLPVFTGLRFPLIWASAVAIGAGLVSSIGYPMSLSRMLALFPFFLAGHLLLSNGNVTANSFTGQRLLAFGAMVAAASCALLLQASGFDERLLYHAKSYSAFGLDPYTGASVRLLAIVLAGGLIWSFLTLIPPSLPSFVTQAGKYSLFCYLSHALLLKAAEAGGVFDRWPEASMSWPYVAASLVFALGLAIALTSKPVRALQTYLYSPLQAAWSAWTAARNRAA